MQTLEPTPQLQRDLKQIKSGSHMAKYIILEHDGELHALLFPASLQHSEMLPRAFGYRPVSAGFFMLFTDGHLVVDGESTTLGLSARKADEAILRNLLTTQSK